MKNLLTHCLAANDTARLKNGEGYEDLKTNFFFLSPLGEKIIFSKNIFLIALIAG